MRKSRFTEEQIIGILKEGEAGVPIAELIRKHGYSTAAFGKWHNTPDWEITPIGPFDRWPTGSGFEYFYVIGSLRAR